MPHEGGPHQEHRLQVAAQPESLDRVHDLLVQLWDDEPDVPTVDRASFETAVVEVTGNIVRHACATAPATITIVLTARSGQLVAELCDTGAAVEVALDGAMPDGLQESGRGLPLACAVTDELVYRRDGDVNCWRLIRRLR